MTRALRSVELTRSQSLAIILLACLPIPLFSLAAMLVPLPEMIERATARFISFAAPTLEEEARDIAVRVRTVPRPDEIRLEQLEVRSVAAPAPIPPRATSRTRPARQATPSSGGGPQTDTGTTSAPPQDAPTDGDTGDEAPPTDESPPTDPSPNESPKQDASGGPAIGTGTEPAKGGNAKGEAPKGEKAKGGKAQTEKPDAAQGGKPKDEPGGKSKDEKKDEPADPDAPPGGSGGNGAKQGGSGRP